MTMRGSEGSEPFTVHGLRGVESGEWVPVSQQRQ
jgi:hypothetical protein